uniref:protein ABHD15 n=1 Tax=Doryrhamphus excisus TaxID=161450 RepID=UPI0025AE29D5|nr:protein ABHD15 [Doryrhamphus excisus]
MLEWLVVLSVAVLVTTVWCNSKVSSGIAKPTSTPQRGSNASGKNCTGTRSVELICKPSALAKYLLRTCTAFTNYSPCVGWTWRASGVLQSFYEAFWWYDSTVHFVRDHLQLSDDGLVALDWAFPRYQKRRRTSSHSTSPVLLIIPNSFGKITRNVVELCQTALSHGYLPAVLNRRSHNGTALTTLKLQQFGDPADLREVVRYIRYRQPAGKLYAVSESTGSGLLLSYLGECGSSSYITAAGCLSPIFRCQSWFENGLSRPLQWALVFYQKMSLSRYRTALSASVHTDNLFSTTSLRGLEEVLFCQTRVSCGGAALTGPSGSTSSASWEAYWECNEPLRDVDEVAIPVLSICAQDDPIRGDIQSTVPRELFESNPHFFLLLTDRGGHCGFSTSSTGAPDPAEAPKSVTASYGTNWSHQALFEFFRATTDFIAAEDRAKQLTARRRGLGTGMGGRVFRHRSVSTCKQVPACSHNIHAIYNWQRSYTR